MSIEFSLTGSSLTLEDWDTFLDEANDWELNEHSDPAFSESGGAHFMVEGSVRGVVLYHEGGPEAITLRLGALSSRADWRAAYELAAKALGKGGGSLEREDGTKLTLADLTPEKANECGEIDLVASVQMVGNMMADHAAKAAAGDDDAIAEMALPLGRFSLPVRASDLAPDFGPGDVESLENVLAGRVARYSTSYHSMTMNLEGGVKVSTWAQIDTVIGNGAHLIACSAFDTEAEGLIPAERLLALLPGRAELLGGGGLFLPEIDLEAEAELRAALEQELVSVEAWAEANKEVLAKESEAAEAASEASEWESYRGLLMFVMGGVSEGNEPQAVAAKLEERGVPQDVARNMVSLIGVSLEHLFDDEGPRDPNLALGELVEKGIPEGLAMVAIDVIVSGMIPPEGAGEGGETA
tara:strand:+ start:646 stop:1878 length:1233 start_codon:yes stop_codon:yes gene_type:complete